MAQKFQITARLTSGLQKKVAAGIALLLERDAKLFRGFVSRRHALFDERMEKLDISSSSHCIGAYLYGSFGAAETALDINHAKRGTKDASRYGLIVSFGARFLTIDDIGALSGELTRIWKEALVALHKGVILPWMQGKLKYAGNHRLVLA